MEEIIKAYGDYWTKVEPGHMGNGWISLYNVDWGDLGLSKNILEHSGMMWRMDTLRHLPSLMETIGN